MSRNPGTNLGVSSPAAAPVAELALASAPLRRREALLAASAKVSRLLLEAPEPMRVMREALHLLGEAADVDRTTLALAVVGPQGERWLDIKSEWLAEGFSAVEYDPSRTESGERKSDCFCPELQAGRTVFLRREESDDPHGVSIAGDRARSSVIVPILVDGEYAGAIGFDDCHQPREFGSAVVSALEIAAGIIGAALHRERLVETMRREREQAAEARVAELANANATIRSNLEQLSAQPDWKGFLEHLMLEASRQLEAASGTIVVLDIADAAWHVAAHVVDGRLQEPAFPTSVRADEVDVGSILAGKQGPQFFTDEHFKQISWPGVGDFHINAGHQSVYLLPMAFGERTVGFFAISFRHRNPLPSERIELLVALAQQATLAIALKRFAISAKNAAVLAERNRISQEIHDGLAQSFTGILMQLGAAEEHMGCTRRTPLPEIIGRVQALARNGLAEARRSVLALKPDRGRVGGLELALRQLAEHSTIEGRVVCTFDGGIASGGPAPELQHELLRIAQEAVINAVRHAHAKSIRVVLIEESADWMLTVIDDGQGMENVPELYAQQGFGLANMRERAETIGGHFEIQSRVGLGTQVIVRLPRPKSQ